MRPGFVLSLLATLLAHASAQQISVSASNTSTVSNLYNSAELTWGNAASKSILLMAFSNSTIATLQQNPLTGSLFHTTASNQLNISNSDIALISCDSASYVGNIGGGDVVTQAENNNALAVILFSTTSVTCEITGAMSQYSQIYTTENQPDGQYLLGVYNSMGASGMRVQLSSTTNPSGPNSNTPYVVQPNQVQGPSPRTATAMIILYSITGAITSMFIVIIIIGAVRAHRHPEIYGQRTVLGIPRRSRARGIAQAMLDTIPIVKFGERESTQPKDIELASTDQVQTKNGTTTSTTVDRERDTFEAETASIRSGAELATGSSQTSQVAIGQPEDIPGCSICTDDFEAGQDLRVLPCDHKFHPACIDPWLLNVSGTCPLCRIDLNPQSSDTNGELPPPIDADGVSPQIISRRRDVFMAIAGFRPMRDQTQEERMDALRQWRAQNTEFQTSSNTDVQRRNRLSNLFGIRTRRRGDTIGQNDVAAQPAAEEGAGGATGSAHEGAQPTPSIGANPSEGSDAPRL